MCGLSLRYKGRWPRWFFRIAGSNQCEQSYSAAELLRVSCKSGPIGHAIFSFSSKPRKCCSTRQFLNGTHHVSWVISLAARHQLPGDACKLVGKGDGYDRRSNDGFGDRLGITGVILVGRPEKLTPFRHEELTPLRV